MTVMTATTSPRLFDAAALEGPARLAYESLTKAQQWVEEHGYQAYEPFDGLSTPLRTFTRHNLLLDRLLQQLSRQSPVNFRPLLGIKPQPSTKGRGYMAAGYLKTYQITGDENYLRKAESSLEWLIEHKSPKFAEHSWANHFDYASRGGRYGTHDSIIVWTALIGQAFVDAFDVTGKARYLDIANSACQWILQLPRERTATGTGIAYHMRASGTVHNASMLGAALLARTWRHTRRQEYLDLAQAAMEYSCTRLRDDGSWWTPITERITGSTTSTPATTLTASSATSSRPATRPGPGISIARSRIFSRISSSRAGARRTTTTVRIRSTSSALRKRSRRLPSSPIADQTSCRRR